MTKQYAKFDSDAIQSYQMKQYHHDIDYHSDIVSIGVVKRLVHIALHFSKYSYGLSLPRSSDKFKKDYTDIFVMVVSAANILNIDLSSQEYNQEWPGDSLLTNYLYFSAIFSKSCESIDHFEEYKFHENWKKSIIGMYKLFEKDAFDNQIDLIELATERLDNVESKIESKSIQFIFKKTKL